MNRLRNRPGSRGSKKQLESVFKAEKEKKTKLYKVKYDKYLIFKPLTKSPFDALIAAAQVKFNPNLEYIIISPLEHLLGFERGPVQAS